MTCITSDSVQHLFKKMFKYEEMSCLKVQVFFRVKTVECFPTNKASTDAHLSPIQYHSPCTFDMVSGTI